MDTNNKVLTLGLTVALLVSVLTVTFTVNDAAANFIPEQPPSGIQISGGNVKGTDLIQKVSDNTFMLTGSIDQTIVIMDNNIVLDGNGHTLEGSGKGTGVFLQAKTGVTIKNLKSQGLNTALSQHGTFTVQTATSKETLFQTALSPATPTAST